ncbi:MAG: TetR/AcrR family transcriptional regulator [Marmoricola sp.]
MLDTPNVSRQTKRREATRREILDAAWEVATEQGLAQITLREVAGRVGMQAPSLYSHFESKHAIHDAMFGQAWTEYLETLRVAESAAPTSPRAMLRHLARTFFEFSASNLARYQLMNQRTIPGFEPSAESYAPAVAALELLREQLAGIGITREEDVDLSTALMGGLVDAQLANDPGGDRWARLVERTTEMFADNVGLPPEA